MDLGESPIMAAERGANEVALPVLASTLTTAVVFFPVTFLYGVSRYLFSALALTVVLALLASYLVAMTIVPLFCARFIRRKHPAPDLDGAAHGIAVGAGSDADSDTDSDADADTEVGVEHARPK